MNKKFEKMHDMYSSLDSMHEKVFYIYHDWMLDIINIARVVMDDEDESYFDKLYNQMLDLSKSAELMNRAIKK
jgi:deoxyadenosine/deoxycytidine kinase